jgi:hypothetical protein
MRRCKDRSSDAVIAPEIGMEFDLLPKAYDFYNLYSWEIGTFVVVLSSPKITLPKGIGMEVRDVFSAKRTRQLNIFSFNVNLPKLYGRSFR